MGPLGSRTWRRSAASLLGASRRKRAQQLPALDWPRMGPSWVFFGGPFTVINGHFRYRFIGGTYHLYVWPIF